jgi:peptidase M28-like protein
MRASALPLAVLLVAIAACDSSTSTPAPSASTRPTTGSPAPSTTSPAPSTASPSPSPSTSVPPKAFDPGAAKETVRYLAEEIGPREATSTAYQRALTWLETRFTAAGYQVTRQPLQVPSGTSWGVPVRAGTTWNLIATRPGFNPAAPHVIVGAHLDTVPQAPGAEDNASGIAVLLGTAETLQNNALPTMFIAFGAEEPRGDGDNRHHYGSRAFVASMSAAQRSAMRGMVSLDRVGVGSVVPVCAAQDDQVDVQRALRAAAARVRVPTRGCTNRSSDHWSFVRAGLPAARLGSTPYAAYHSARDLPGVVQAAQLGRMGQVLASWLRG